MVGIEMYAEIKKRKLMGYSKRACARELNVDRKTIRKYWDMEEGEYAGVLIESKRRTRGLDEYRNFIVGRLNEYPEITSAIIEDHLREEYGERFNISYRSVSQYVSDLREELGLPKPVTIRQYCAVSETPLGYQAQVDMGVKKMKDMYGKTVKIYIFAMVLSASRMKFVCFSETPYKAESFIEAHDLAFRYFGGRTIEVVYDQDRVMTVSENAGDILYTEAFESYRRYAGFSIRLCRGNDPQSKGKIERVVGYVKNNYLSCRNYQGIQELNSGGLAWLDRTANNKIHDTTKMVPKHVFKEESKHLIQVPSLSKPLPPKTAIIRKDNVVHYRQNRYAVPRGSYAPGRRVRIGVDEEAGTVTFHDAVTDEKLALHNLYYGRGKLIGLPQNAGRYKETRYENLKNDVLKAFETLDGAEEYIDRIIEKYPRYVRDQLIIIRNTQKSYELAELQKAINYCLERELISANDFRDTLSYFRAAEAPIEPRKVSLPTKYSLIVAQARPVNAYIQAFEGNKGGNIS